MTTLKNFYTEHWEAQISHHGAECGVVPPAVVAARQVGGGVVLGGQAAGEGSGAGDAASISWLLGVKNSWMQDGVPTKKAVIGVAASLAALFFGIPEDWLPQFILLYEIFIWLPYFIERKTLPWLRWLPFNFSHILPHIPWDALVLLSAF